MIENTFFVICHKLKIVSMRRSKIQTPTYLNNINVQYNIFEGPTIYKLIEQKLQLLRGR